MTKQQPQSDELQHQQQQQLPDETASNKKKKEKVVCENCDKSTQVDLPPPPVDDTTSSISTTSSVTSLCRTQYQNVDRCMRENKGQISKCAVQWDAFRKCHDDENKDRRI
jgi:uncharacterized protein YgiB involved in biofilm formation